MFANFSFPSSPSSTEPSSPSRRRTSTSTSENPSHLDLPYGYREMTPPLSPCARADTEEPDYFTENPLAATMESMQLSAPFSPSPSPAPSLQQQRRRGTAFAFPSPDASDDDSDEALERRRAMDIRSKRQAFAALQTDEDMLRSLGELVKRVGYSSGGAAAGARKNSVVEGGGVSKKTATKSKVHVRVRSVERKPKSEHHHHHHHYHNSTHHAKAAFGGMRLWCAGREQRRGAVVEF